MATVTAYAQYLGMSTAGTPGTWTNVNNVTDNDETTYGSFSVTKGAYSDFHVQNFDLSAIPEGAVINSVKLYTYLGTDSNMTVHMYAVRKYVNGSFADNGSVDSSTVWIAAGQLDTFVFDNSDRIGSWTRDELSSWKTGDVQYTGIGFYIRVKNTTSSLFGSTKKIHPRYFKVVVDYTLPTYTVLVGREPVAGGTVSGGGAYAFGTEIVIQAFANTGYKFKQWNDGNTESIRTVTVQKNIAYTAYFEEISLPKISSVQITPNPCVTGQGFIISVVFTE